MINALIAITVFQSVFQPFSNQNFYADTVPQIDAIHSCKTNEIYCNRMHSLKPISQQFETTSAQSNQTVGQSAVKADNNKIILEYFSGSVNFRRRNGQPVPPRTRRMGSELQSDYIVTPGEDAVVRIRCQGRSIRLPSGEPTGIGNICRSKETIQRAVSYSSATITSIKGRVLLRYPNLSPGQNIQEAEVFLELTENVIIQPTRNSWLEVECIAKGAIRKIRVNRTTRVGDICSVARK